jgi:hypothetical protein
VDNFEDWNKITKALDILDINKKRWRENDESAFYDFRKIKAKRILLQNLREREDVEGLQFQLR